jgi:hypothetical protein
MHGRVSEEGRSLVSKSELKALQERIEQLEERIGQLTAAVAPAEALLTDSRWRRAASGAPGHRCCAPGGGDWLRLALLRRRPYRHGPIAGRLGRPAYRVHLRGKHQERPELLRGRHCAQG